MLVCISKDHKKFFGSLFVFVLRPHPFRSRHWLWHIDAVSHIIGWSKTPTQRREDDALRMWNSGDREGRYKDFCAIIFSRDSFHFV